jgi:hypothetical protein
MPDEIRGLQRALERLVADPSVRRAMAERGQRWARATFTASNYAAQITDMAKIVLASRHAIDMISNLSAQMSHWKASPDLMLSKDIVDPLRIFDRSF